MSKRSRLRAQYIEGWETMDADKLVSAVGAAFAFDIVDKVVRDEDGVLLEWYWWRLAGTDVEGAAVIKTTDEGVVFERLAYYRSPWPLRD